MQNIAKRMKKATNQVVLCPHAGKRHRPLVADPPTQETSQISVTFFMPSGSNLPAWNRDNHPMRNRDGPLELKGDIPLELKGDIPPSVKSPQLQLD